jgi:hypothetical protein
MGATKKVGPYMIEGQATNVTAHPESPTWCTKKRRKHQRIGGKVERLGKQKAKHLLSSPHKTSNMYSANHKLGDFRTMLKIMLEKEWSCYFFEMLF